MAVDMSLQTVKQKTGTPLKLNRFYADFPALGDQQEDNVTYFLQSSSTPTKTIGEILINWQGLQYKVPGDVTYAPITITFLCDQELTAYKYAQLWQSLVVDDLTNSRGQLDEVKKDIDLHQLEDNGAIKGTWFMKGMFPTEVGEIAYDRDSADAIATFTVTFAFDNYTFSST